MKKLKLMALELGAAEVLTKSQLKNVLGGTGTGGNDACAGQASTAQCRDASGNNLGSVSQTGCSSATTTASCSKYTTFSITQTTCTC